MSINSKRKRDQKKTKIQRSSKFIPPALHQLDKFRKQYIKQWKINSNDHLVQGHYDWMTSKVDGYPRLLEIGCGIGHSTLALLKKGHTVTCIEENPHCIAHTQALVADHGYSVAVIKRATAQDIDNNAYRLSYNAIANTPNADCLLIEGDALKDVTLEEWLASQPHFDSVVCWLLGTHNSRGHNEAVDTNLMPTAFEHRIFVQNNVYELADIILRSGGILNVIDRAQTPSTDFLTNAMLDNHRDQASVTSLEVQTLDHIPYKGTQEDGAMEMLLTVPVQVLDHDSAPTVSLCAITSMKP